MGQRGIRRRRPLLWLATAVAGVSLFGAGHYVAGEPEPTGATVEPLPTPTPTPKPEVIKVPVPGPTVIKKVPGKTVIKEVRVPGKTVVKTVRVPVPGKTVIKEVPGPVRTVPGPTVTVRKCMTETITNGVSRFSTPRPC